MSNFIVPLRRPAPSLEQALKRQAWLRQDQRLAERRALTEREKQKQDRKREQAERWAVEQGANHQCESDR